MAKDTSITGIALGVGAAVPPSISQGPDIPPASPGTLDDEFSGTSLSGAWTLDNQSTMLFAVSNSLLKVTASGGNTGVSSLLKSTPATPWEVTAGPFKVNGSNLSFNSGCGLVMKEASSGKEIIFGFLNVNVANGWEILNIGQWTNNTTFSSNPVQLTQNWYREMYLRIQDNGTNHIFSYSWDGINFTTHATRLITAWFTADATSVGVFFNAADANEKFSLDWFRRTL